MYVYMYMYVCVCVCVCIYMRGFSRGSEGKESACNTGDPSLIPGSGSSPGEGIGYPLQYSWAPLLTQMVKSLPAMQETWHYGGHIEVTENDGYFQPILSTRKMISKYRIIKVIQYTFNWNF